MKKYYRIYELFYTSIMHESSTILREPILISLCYQFDSIELAEKAIIEHGYTGVEYHIMKVYEKEK